MDSYELPPMRVVQKGIVVRFNQNTGKFIEPNSGDLISSIYLNADNEFRIGGEFIWALDGEVDPHCPGRDNTAAANNGVRQPTDTAINDFKAFQCSSATRILEPIGERCVPFFFGSTSCTDVLMPNRKAITSIEALPREFALPPDRPCVHPPDESEALEPERTMNQIFSGSNVFALYGNFDDALDFRRRHYLSPGEEVRIFLSLRAWESPQRMALVPVLNGAPVGPVWWAEQSLHERGSGEFRHRRIDARRYIDVTMPEEPGVYNFQVITWPAPFEIRNHPDGRVDDDVPTSLLDRASNHLTFEVVE